MRSLALIWLPLAVLGCTPPRTIRVTNKLSTAVGLHVDRDLGTRGWQEKMVLIQPGETRKFGGWAVFDDEGFVTLRVQACDYRYDVPAAHPTPKIKWPLLFGVSVRMTPDSTPELVPVVGGSDSGGQFLVEALVDQPVSPTTRSCPQTAPAS